MNMKDQMLVLGDMLNFHIVLSSACEIADTRYYCANLFIYLVSLPES